MAKHIWLKEYKNYISRLKTFYNYCIKLSSDYKEFPIEKQCKISRRYLSFFYETLDIFKSFFYSNSFLITKNQELVNKILALDIFSDGYLFFNLYIALKKHKRLPSKYFQKKYLDLFCEIEKFLEERFKLEGIRNV